MGGNYLLAGIMEGPRGVKGETAIYTLATPYVGWILDNSDAEKCQVQLPGRKEANMIWRDGKLKNLIYFLQLFHRRRCPSTASSNPRHKIFHAMWNE